MMEDAPVQAQVTNTFPLQPASHRRWLQIRFPPWLKPLVTLLVCNWIFVN